MPNTIPLSFSSHSDLWLNEGITTYFSYYVTGDFMEDPALTDFLFMRAQRLLTVIERDTLSWDKLENDIESERKSGVFSSVPSLKGALFMKHLVGVITSNYASSQSYYHILHLII